MPIFSPGAGPCDINIGLHDMRIPVSSTLGMGPRGHDIAVDSVEGSDGSYVLRFKDSVTGEVLHTTPNIDPGSRIYVCTASLTYVDGTTSYSAAKSSFADSQLNSADEIRNGDIVIFKAAYEGSSETDVIGVGIVTSVSGNLVSFASNIEMNSGRSISEKVSQWLEEHPEATTTVEDNSITEQKLNPSLRHTTNISDNEIIVHPIGSESGLDINTTPIDGIVVIANSILKTWSSISDVTTTRYSVSDANIIDGDVVVTATIADVEHILNSSQAGVIVTVGSSVSVALTTTGVNYVKSLMQESEVTSGTLSIEWPHVVMGIARLSFVGTQQIGGIGRIIKIRNTNWSNSQRTETFFDAHNTVTNARVLFGVGSGGYNRGIWDTLARGWIIYRNSRGETIIGGPNFSVSSNGAIKTRGGGHSNLSGRLTVANRVTATDTGGQVSLVSAITGNKGVWDDTEEKWLVWRNTDGELVLGTAGSSDPLYRHESTCTINTANATVYNNFNRCWSNNACCTVQLCVNLKSSLANADMVDVATAPTGYRPPHVVFGSVMVTGQNVNLQAEILGDGTIRVNNRSGSAITASSNIYMSFTFAS